VNYVTKLRKKVNHILQYGIAGSMIPISDCELPQKQ